MNRRQVGVALLALALGGDPLSAQDVAGDSTEAPGLANAFNDEVAERLWTGSATTFGAERGTGRSD